MSRSKIFRLMTLGVMGLMLHACGIPEITIKKADTQLPDRFKLNLAEKANSGTVKWEDFFEDPNLLSLIDIAIANNKEVNMMLQRISTAENEIQARRGAYLPSVNIGIGADGEKVGKYTRNGAVEENLKLANGQPFPAFLGNYQFGLFSTWEIDIWKKLRNAKQVAVLEYMASQEGKNFLVTNLVSEIAHAYYELMALDNQLENLEQNIAIQQNGLEVVKQLQIYARTTTLAVKRYQAEVAKNQSKKSGLMQQITEVENRINFLLGRAPQPIQRASRSFMDIKPKILNAGIPSQLLQNRPDIRKAELELAAAELNIEVARANFYPSFGIKAGIGFEAFALKYLINTPESLAAMVAGELVAPLVNKNAIIAEYKNASAKQIQAAYEYEQTILNAYTEVANQLSKIDNLDKAYRLKKEQVDSLAQSIDVAGQLFKSARADYLEVLLTQRDALDAKKELIETKLQQLNAVVDLYRSLGGGWQ
ncbi:outer membrane protein, multidrug efflux system [Methylocaldum szegediense]|uniref:Outer membrane protein, multidrug efflux system n=2 Tax=Methylocaldum szegediense TaxID=73780 RepID=A0ABM9I0S7_9GAMM|nr:outer membrane protein, multidrug efflux system [Methylocaldum szegediense]